MVKVKESMVAYRLLEAYKKNVRITKREINENISPHSTYYSTTKLLNRIREKMVLFGPRLWINQGYTVDLKNSKRSSIVLFEKYKKIPEVAYLMALMGAYSLLIFKKGASILKYAKCITPSYPAKKRIPEIELTEKGIIERDEYPKWDELDWEVFFKMRDPTRSFGKVAGELGVYWVTVRNKFEKILKDCDIWLSFYPEGYKSYQKALLTFKTKYEQNLKNELGKIDRTSFLYKYGNTILLILFYEDFNDLRKFEILKKEGKIKNLSFSTPIDWHDNF